MPWLFILCSCVIAQLQLFSCDKQFKRGLCRSVCLFALVLVAFFSLLVSLESVVHLECRKASKNPFNGVSRKFKGCFKEVLMVFTDSFQGSLKGVSRKFQESFN